MMQVPNAKLFSSPVALSLLDNYVRMSTLIMHSGVILIDYNTGYALPPRHSATQSLCYADHAQWL